MLIASGASEGVEETLESLLQPFLQQLSYDKDAQTVFQNPKLLADAAYEGLIGGILGMFGGGTSTAIDLVSNMIYDGTMPGEKLMADAGVGESEVLGAMAIHEMGKMDNAAETGGTRPTWKQSELDAASDFPNYNAQQSFLKGEPVPYGTKDSVRPDYYIAGHSVDIKNYNLETASGRRNLAYNVQQQYLRRVDNLPNQTAQSVMVDIRGQNVTDTILSELYDDLMKRTDGNIEVLFKMN